MRKFLSVVLLVALLAALPMQAFAAVTGDPAKAYTAPILITNAGQGPGGKMARLLVGQAKTLTLDTDFFYKSEPVAEDLKERAYSALVVVIGSTDKGLGASGITIDDEVARLETMVAAAKEINLPVVAVLLEKDKRSNIATNPNERCIDVICPAAEWMIVVKEGNSDGRFDKLKEELGIPLTIIDNAIDFTELSKTAFVK
ncbi:MAG: DUF6305 family protein [Clostridia bacterium]